MTIRIRDWRGQDVDGVYSSGSQVFSALDWRQLVLPIGGPHVEDIMRKAARSSPRLSDYDPAAQIELKKCNGRYCALQSISSEDTVTWSVFGAFDFNFWAEDLLSLAFGPSVGTPHWKLHFWKRLPHPETGKIQHGPEADVMLESDGIGHAIEAKWLNTDIDKDQGRSRNKTQLEMRSPEGPITGRKHFKALCRRHRNRCGSSIA